MSTYLKTLNQRIDKLAADVASQIPVIEVKALTAGYIPMMNRIFGQGVDGGGFAKDGSGFGSYTERWRQIRFGEIPLNKKTAKKVYGRNFQKNLVFNGNLRNSIQLGIKDGKNCIGYTDLDLKEIAEFQETSSIQINKPIFGFDETEKEARDLVVEAESRNLVRGSFVKV